MILPASSTCTAPSGCFLVHPAPATNRSFASGRIVCSSCLGARKPVTSVRSAGSSTAMAISSTSALPLLRHTAHACRNRAAETRPRGTRHNCFNPLAVIPARRFNVVCSAEGRNVRVDETSQAVRDRGHHPREPQTLRRHNNRGLGGAPQRLARSRVGGKRACANARPRNTLAVSSPAFATALARADASAATMPMVSAALRRAASSTPAVTTSSECLGKRGAGFISMRKYENGFHILP